MPPGLIRVGVDATTWWNDRGFGRFTRELMRALVARGQSSGFEYAFVVDRPRDETIPAEVDVIEVGTTKSLNEAAVGKGSRSPAYLFHLGRAVSRAQFDVFFFPAVYSFFPLLSRVPRVVCYHDTTPERFPDLLFPTKLNARLWAAKTKLAIWQTTRAMAVSNATARDVHDILGIPKDRIDVVTEGADPVFRVLDDEAAIRGARDQFGIPRDATLFVYVGGLNPHKNLLGMLRALPRVIEARPDAHFAIVGDTSGKGFWDNVDTLKAFVKDTPGLAEHVHFTGFASDEELVRLLNSSVALVFPSLWEGFGLPAVEALQCGVPVLCSDRASLPEVVGDAGLFFDPLSPWSISSCLLEFLNDEAKQADLRARALPRARTFTWQKAAELAEVSFRRCHEQASGRRR